MPSKDAANWVAHPEDLTTVLQFLHSQKSRAGEGGNFDKTVFSEAAAHMAANCPPKKGGPKTADSIAQKWKGVREYSVPAPHPPADTPPHRCATSLSRVPCPTFSKRAIEFETERGSAAAAAGSEEAA
ncbi:hypothetical protein C8J57DRAFT_1728809 [Mycena rebaudengoi]|nr:hypothetical protein C8J57DRAFT_1728809 [Mycena rebaudengoi]